MSISDPSQLKSLGSGGSDFKKIEKSADFDLLERFPNPMQSIEGALVSNVVQLGGYEDPKEFTSLCPKTGQPDFARICVRYAPDKWCVESKSWKLYLGSYRSAQEFHEACVAQIGAHLVELLDPWMVYVQGEFTPRGGISINPEWSWRRMTGQPSFVMTTPEEDFDDEPPETKLN